MSLNSFRNGLENITSTTVGKWSMIGVGALLAFGLVAAGWSNLRSPMGGDTAATRSGEDIIATVNGDPITRTDYDSSVQALQSSPMLAGHTVSVAEQPLFNNAALQQVINARLQVQQAKAMNLTVSDAEVAKKRAEIVDLSGLRSKLSLPPTASLSDVDAALTKAGDQTVEQKLPDDTLRQMILLGDPQSGQPGKVQTALAGTVVVGDDEARQSFTKYHTRHILIDNKKRSDVQAKAQALEILAKAKAPGADFAALAKQYSDDPGTKAKGGDDGFIDENTQYIPEFKKAAFSLKPGEVTPDPVASAQYGYFIIKLDEVKVALPPDFEKNKAKYLAQIKQERADTKYQDLMKSLQDSAKIDVKDPALAGDRAFAKAGQLGPQAQPKYQEAQADYQKALQGNPPALEKAAINAALGQVYQNLRQTPQAIAAYEAALKSRDDPALEMTLGKLYLDNKDNAKAAAHFQQASQLAWNDQSTHVQLISYFRQAGRADLATKELDWLKAHPAPGGPGGMPGMPGGGVPSGIPAGAVHVTVPPSARSAPKPAH